MFDRVVYIALVSVCTGLFFSYRKRLSLSILMNRAQEGAIDELQVLQKELDNLQKEIKSLNHSC